MHSRMLQCTTRIYSMPVADQSISDWAWGSNVAIPARRLTLTPMMHVPPPIQVPEGFVKLCTPLSNSRYQHMMRFPDPEEEDDESEEEGDDDDEDDEGEGDGHEHKHDHHGHDHDHSGCCGHKHHVSACCLELNLLHALDLLIQRDLI